MPDQRYKSSLKDGRISDAEAVTKYLKTQATIETLLNELSMSTKAEDKPILPLALILYQIFSRQDEQSKICADVIKLLYDKHLHDVDARLCGLERVHTAKFWWARVQWISEAGKILLTIAAVVALTKGFGL